MEIRFADGDAFRIKRDDTFQRLNTQKFPVNFGAQKATCLYGFEPLGYSHSPGTL